MTVTVHMMGRLGNNLFQYALGRTIAEHHGWSLRCRDAILPTNSELVKLCSMGPTVTLSGSTNHFNHAPLEFSGRSFSAPRQMITPSGLENFDYHTIDFQGILDCATPRHIHLFGFFQRSEYYSKNRNAIRRWFSSTTGTAVPDLSPNDIVLNYRGGLDFKLIRSIVNFGYYRAALESMDSPGRLFVCGVRVPEELLEGLRPFKPMVVEGAPLVHFELMRKARRLILSNSTFAWWAAFLGDTEHVTVPIDERDTGFHFHKDGVNLTLDHCRYDEITCCFR